MRLVEVVTVNAEGARQAVAVSPEHVACVAPAEETWAGSVVWIDGVDEPITVSQDYREVVEILDGRYEEGRA